MGRLSGPTLTNYLLHLHGCILRPPPCDVAWDAALNSQFDIT